MEHGNDVSGYAIQPGAGHGQRQPSSGEAVDPLTELADLHRRLDALATRLITESAAASGVHDRSIAEPELDIYENDQAFLIHAAVPGAAPDAIRVEASAHSVTLSAETPSGRTLEEPAGAHSGVTRHRRSRHADLDRYHFVYILQCPIVPEQTRAVLRHGIVEIHLPKARQLSAPVAIPVSLHDDLSTRPHVPAAAAVASNNVVVVRSREGSPGQKLGAAYVPSAGEDHTAKAQSIGEQPAPGRSAPALSDRVRTAEAADAHQPGYKRPDGKLP